MRERTRLSIRTVSTERKQIGRKCCKPLGWVEGQEAEEDPLLGQGLGGRRGGGWLSVEGFLSFGRTPGCGLRHSPESRR